MPGDTFSALGAPGFEGGVALGTGVLGAAEVRWGAGGWLDLVRRGRGGWARRRASEGREVGQLPERRLSCWQGCVPRRGGDRSLPLVDGRLPGPSARGPRRVALAAAPSPDAHPARCLGPAGPAWPGDPAPRPRGRCRRVHPRVRWAPAAAFQGASPEAGAGLWGADRLPGT